MITIRKRGSLEDPCHFPQTHFASTQISNSGKKKNDDDARDNEHHDGVQYVTVTRRVYLMAILSVLRWALSFFKLFF